MADTTINLCGNNMLKSVKMHFFWYYRNCTVLKCPWPFFTGLRNHFFFQIGTVAIVKNRFKHKKKKKKYFLEEKCGF